MRYRNNSSTNKRTKQVLGKQHWKPQGSSLGNKHSEINKNKRPDDKTNKLKITI